MRLIDADLLNEYWKSWAINKNDNDIITVGAARTGFAWLINAQPTAEPKLLQDEQPHGTYECFHCGQRAVVWSSDFMFEDFGYEGEGLVHLLYCSNFGAEIEYRIPIEESGQAEE